MKRLKVRWRLTLWYGAVLTVIVLGFGICVYAMMARHLLVRTDFELDEELQELQVEVGLAQTEEMLLEQLRARFYHHLSFNFQVSRLDGTLLFRSSVLDRRDDLIPYRGLPISTTGSYRETRRLPGLGPMRIASRIAVGPRLKVVTQATIPLLENDQELWALLMTLLAAAPLAIIAAVAGGSLLARHAMEPVHRMAATAALITGSRLATRIEIENPDDELGNLAATLNSMMDRLEQAVEELRRFTADAAHELRTPLAVLQTEVEIALRTPRTAEEYRRVLEVTWGESRRLTRLTDQLLQLARHDCGLLTRRHDEVPFDALIADIVDQLRVLAINKGVTLELGPLQEWLVTGDDIQLGQLLFNLLDNAIKFTPPGGRVHVQAEERAGQVVVTISDTGIGIPAEDLPFLGRRFYRADKSRNEKTGGTGLGLSISKAIVEAHGGTLSIDSELQVGTTVRIRLPLAAAAARTG